MRGLATLAALIVTGCTPIMQMRPETVRYQDLAPAVAFCAARASGDMEAVAGLFVADVASALRAAGPASLHSAGLQGPCSADRVWYWGGSRSFAEVRYAQGSDGLDLWRGDGGLIADVVYGDGSGTLRQKLGLPSGSVPPPASLFRR